ncbi:restriction endonuclease subunit S [Finegoldia magna]|uniref:restriction endonuclease subunit S n=1 Tax=Finegoldia TaxID=150022 RepID=UPI000B918966|nr:restriction endonuclease subunit S [Finegoldia magna]OXZ24821.1 hypothetical protein B9N52_08000 [Finegoldia magna]
MSRLEELIQELCPNGVEYKPLSDKTLFAFRYGKGNKIPEDTGGQYDVYGANGIVSHIDEYNCEDVTIIGHIGAVGLINRVKGKCFVTYNGTIATVVDKEKVDSQYLYYVLTTLDLPSRKKGSQPFLSVSDFDKIAIPVPPLEVQREIVRILDSFTLLTAELTAELTARKKQYEYYTDELLKVDDSIKTVALEEIAENCDSLRKPVSSGNREAGEYPYYGASGIVDYVSDYIFDGDYLLVSEDGANLLARSTPIAFSISGKNWVNNHAHVLRFETYATRRYVEFYLNSIDLSPWISGGAQPKLNQKNLNKINIPLPSLAEQERIVGILDRFDSLCNDISEGLPAEIEARQKQYEFYRDKLLSFEQL